MGALVLDYGAKGPGLEISVHLSFSKQITSIERV